MPWLKNHCSTIFVHGCHACLENPQDCIDVQLHVSVHVHVLSLSKELEYFLFACVLIDNKHIHVHVHLGSLGVTCGWTTLTCTFSVHVYTPVHVENLIVFQLLYMCGLSTTCTCTCMWDSTQVCIKKVINIVLR